MEPLILYFVLFFPGVFNSGIQPDLLQETIPFSIIQELSRILTYTIPSFALIWYLISDKKDLSALWDEKVRKRDLFPFIIGFPALVLVGAAISALASAMSSITGTVPSPVIEAPASPLGWIVMVISCLGTGYLEESYFRHYLLNWLERPVPNLFVRIAISTVLFSACHIYEGPWGILNAALAGISLSVLYIRRGSLHGIAWAHGAYNAFVYFTGIFGSQQF